MSGPAPQGSSSEVPKDDADFSDLAVDNFAEVVVVPEEEAEEKEEEVPQALVRPRGSEGEVGVQCEVVAPRPGVVVVVIVVVVVGHPPPVPRTSFAWCARRIDDQAIILIARKTRKSRTASGRLSVCGDF